MYTTPGKALLGARGNNPSTLFWLIVLRALILLTFVFYVLSLDFDDRVFRYLGLIIFASIAFTVVTWLRNSSPEQNTSGLYVSQLLWDSVVINVFVWLAGGSTNPFIYYQLLVIAVSASILPERIAWVFSLLGIGSYSVLLYFDIGHHMQHLDASFKSHLLGMWINFTGSALLIAFFISRLSAALVKREKDLRVAREENLKNEQLLGLGILAATTVHSFGTPLSTIRMAVSELDALHPDAESRACTSVIQAQIERCKDTMNKLTVLTTKEDLSTQTLLAADLFDEVKEYALLVNMFPMPEICVPETMRHCRLPGGVLLLHAIINLVDNAVKAAGSYVNVTLEETSDKRVVRILIEDDGDGIQSDTVYTTEEVGMRKDAGLGIGLILVNSTIERLGGRVHFANSTDVDSGTKITVELTCLD